MKVFEERRNQAYFLYSSIERFARDARRGNSFKIFWCTGQPIRLRVDLHPVTVRAGQLCCVAPRQQLEVVEPGEGIVFQYNREFYCIVDHDKEVSCVGLLYYGSTATPIIDLDAQQQRKIELLAQVFADEFDTRDDIQEEMLRMLLKRLIILCTRWFKVQSDVSYDDEELDLIRQFNLLIELHFKEKQTVTEYAELLHKSPKTLANVFAKNSETTPLKRIHERIALEARRLLIYTDKSVKEIGWELNFAEDAHFSRFFKRVTGYAPTEFRREVTAISGTAK